MNNITFGRYTTENTVVHKLDPRNKIVLMILLMITIFLPFQVWSTTLILTGLVLAFLIVVMFLSKVNFFDLFRSIKGMWFLILFLMVIYFFIPDKSYTLPIPGTPFYYDAFYRCGYIVLRLIMLLSITTILTTTTKPMDLTYGLEFYMSPLKVIHFPSHEIAMTLSIALRFIPTLLDETNRIIKAQSSRGVDFEHGGIFKKFKAIISLIIPLFVSAIERSEELSNAMEVRGYNPKSKRSRYRMLKFHWCDLFAFLIVGAIFGGILTLSIYDQNIIQINIIYAIFGKMPLF